MKLKLQAIKGSYDLIVSLGSECTPALQLRRLHLRKFSSPLDWVVSPSLSDVSLLLKNRFANYMALRNMHLIEGVSTFVDHEVVQPVKSYYVKDSIYNIISVHDFPVLPNKYWTATYPAYKQKLQMRINRLLNSLATSQRVLFIRRRALYPEAAELQSVLSGMIKNQYAVLILNPIEGLQRAQEEDWGLNRVCVVNVPRSPKSQAVLWNQLLSGVTLNG